MINKQRPYEEDTIAGYDLRSVGRLCGFATNFGPRQDQVEKLGLAMEKLPDKKYAQQYIEFNAAKVSYCYPF